VIWKGHTGEPNGANPDPGLLAITVEDVLQAVSDLSSASPWPDRKVEWVASTTANVMPGSD
jgi:hypothetical protein